MPNETSQRIGPLKVRAEAEQWPLVEPFRITGHVFTTIDVLVVSLEKDGHTGRGEGDGVYYRGDTPAGMIRELEPVIRTIEAGISIDDVQKLLPPGGARNALDCALWDLQAKLGGRPVWELAGLATPRPLLTTFTCGAEAPEKMVAVARAYRSKYGARAIKLKLTGEPLDADRVRAVRAALPDVWLGVDANQGFTRESLDKLLPALVAAGVQLIEQPFPMGKEAWMEGLRLPIPAAADESAQTLADVPSLAGRFQIMNIKLDKCGGLTEGLAMARQARELGLECMVGNMVGSSLAMAPSFLVGQLCKVVDLDGPGFLKTDRALPVRYADGMITCPEALWGHP